MGLGLLSWVWVWVYCRRLWGSWVAVLFLFLFYFIFVVLMVEKGSVDGLGFYFFIDGRLWVAGGGGVRCG